MMTEIGQCLRSSDTSMESVILKQSTIGKQRDLDPLCDSSGVDNDIIDEVDSEDIPPAKVSNSENLPFYQQLLQRMNPVECLSPAVTTVASSSVSAVHGCSTSAYKSCFSSDREEFEFVLHDLLKDIRVKYIGVANHKSTTRIAALQRLYRLTDREHAHNRYVHASCFVVGFASQKNTACGSCLIFFVSSHHPAVEFLRCVQRRLQQSQLLSLVYI